MGTRVYHAVRRLIAARIGPQRAAVPVASNSTGGTNVDRNARESTTSHGRDGICGLIAISLWLAVAFGCVPGAVHCVTDLGQVDVQGRLVRADGLPVAGIDIELRLIPSASDTAYSGALLTAAAPSDNGGFLHHVLSFRGGSTTPVRPPMCWPRPSHPNGRFPCRTSLSSASTMAAAR